MQNKGLLTTFTVLFAIASLYALSLTWVAAGVESDAKAYAEEYHEGSSDAEFQYLDSMSAVEVYPLINYTYGELRGKMLNLGLDLKGGMNVTLEIQTEDIVKVLSKYNQDPIFIKAISDAKALQKETNKDFVTLFGEAFTGANPNGKLTDYFYNLDTKDNIKADATNEEVLAFIDEAANAAIAQSFEVLTTRINLFGAAQPSIQRITGSDRISVELPGVKDKERVRKLLQGTAKLEFWETYENRDVYPLMARANDKLAQLLNGAGENDTTKINVPDSIAEPVTSLEPIDTASEESDISELLGDTNSSLLKEVNGAQDSLALLAKSIKENPLFAILTTPTNQTDQGRVFAEGPVVGIVALKDTAKVNEFLAMKEIQAIFSSRKYKFFWSYKPFETDDKRKFLQLYAIKSNRSEQAPLEGDVIVDATQEFGQFNGSPEIRMVMNGQGASAWANLTEKNVGKGIAIVLDNLVYSAPAPSEKITGGVSSITGQFEIEEAKLVANILKAGKLPVEARIVEEAVVGPTLGQESINKGMLSFLVALLIVLAYMVFYYSKAGVASVIALIANMFFIFGVLASMPSLVALTLPGIAGIILTIGMSVDANVLIFERIREETRAGKGIRLAIADGYKFAYTSIIDANVTTLLTGFVLWFFGTGPVEGFAKTLVIGIFTSLFTAIFITRLIFEFNLNKNKNVSFSTKLTEGAFKNLGYRFLKNRKKYYILSGFIILLGVGSLMTKGLQRGVDFKGGRSYVVRFAENTKIDSEKIAKNLTNYFGTTPEVKTFGDDNQIKITTTYLIDSDAVDADETVENKLFEGLQTILGNDVDKDQFDEANLMSSQKVGPTIADDMIRASLLSIVFSLIIIFLYILFRFKKWQFGLGALVALFHDVLIVLSLFSLLYGFLPFSLEVDQAFIAAILTVVGYSINDTVVVFDRIREYLGSYKKQEVGEVINNALNSTLSRTVNTSLSTIFVLLMIFIFGGEVIRGFSFALLIGVIVGTYSSLCIASPVMYDLVGKTVKKDK